MAIRKAEMKSLSDPKAIAEVKKIVENFVRDNPRLELADAAEFEASEGGIQNGDEVTDMYRKHLGISDPN